VFTQGVLYILWYGFSLRKQAKVRYSNIKKIKTYFSPKNQHAKARWVYFGGRKAPRHHKKAITRISAQL
jgi:hypothetical protein